MEGYFTTDYAKSNRSKCQKCKYLIQKDSLRLGVAIPSPTFEGMMTRWYHSDCFFEEHKPIYCSGIQNFNFLRFNDQEFLRHKVEGKPLKQASKSFVSCTKITNLAEFFVSYCKMNVKCWHCKKDISVNEVKVVKGVQEKKLKQLNLNSWIKSPETFSQSKKTKKENEKSYHAVCFGKVCDKLGYDEEANKLPGFSELKNEDQCDLLLTIPYVSFDDAPAQKKKRKINDGLTNKERKLKEQNDLLYRYIDGLKTLKPAELKLLLTENKQQVIAGVVKIQLLADAMAFGALRPCRSCGGQFVPHEKGYSCKGQTAWSRCRSSIRVPFRNPFVVSDKLKAKHDFLKNYRYESRDRVYQSYRWDEHETGPSQEFMEKQVSQIREAVETFKRNNYEFKDNVMINLKNNKEHKVHVYQESDAKYDYILNYANVQSGGNGFYKMQILESDDKLKYWVYAAWGQIGTERRDHYLKEFAAVNDARKHFEKTFKNKTGNNWKERDLFKKKPSKMFLVDVVEEDVDFILNEDVPSSLPKPVQDLVNLIYDVDLMKKLMSEFKLDMTKMPLGKISKKQLSQAYSILKDLQRLYRTGGTLQDFVEGSNQFYTLVPHNFGGAKPPLIQSEEEIEEKRQMIDNLMEIQTTCTLIKEGKAESGNIIDIHYAKLKSIIVPLDVASDEYNLIQEYLCNTHAETHNSYALKIDEVFRVTRQGENRRYEPFKGLHNRKLLWHGSRITNFAGILSQGLRIAPKEAPTTGYMFGKGIYFADMVSKSANYCCATSGNNEGLLLLCEVALGNMLECTRSHYIRELPEDKHSVKGIGKTQPDPLEAKILPDGVEVPCGKGVTNDIESELLYNEYIIYDVAQVNVKYLVKVTFEYK